MRFDIKAKMRRGLVKIVDVWLSYKHVVDCGRVTLRIDDGAGRVTTLDFDEEAAARLRQVLGEAIEWVEEQRKKAKAKDAQGSRELMRELQTRELLP